MDVLLELREKSRRLGRRVVLPESQDPRVVQAAAALASEGLCHPVLLETRGMGSAPAGVETLRPERDPRLERFAEELYELRKHKGMTPQEARERVRDPLLFAGFLLRSGDCHAAVAGSVSATSDILRTGLWVVGHYHEAAPERNCDCGRCELGSGTRSRWHHRL